MAMIRAVDGRSCIRFGVSAASVGGAVKAFRGVLPVARRN